MSNYTNKSLVVITFNRNLTPIILLFNFFKNMCITYLYDDYNPPLNKIQLMVSEVLMFNENTELIPYGDSYDVSTGNNDPTMRSTLLLVGITVINQLGLVEAAKEK